MEQEATDELHRIELHDLAAVVVFGVAPAKTHLTIDQAQQSAVGDGNAYESSRVSSCVAGALPACVGVVRS